MSQPLQAATASSPRPQIERTRTSGSGASASSAVQTIFAGAARGSQPLALSAPTTVVPRRTEGIVPAKVVRLEDWRPAGRSGRVLYYHMPEHLAIFAIDVRANFVSQWLPFAYKRKVYAPKPHKNYEFCLGEMITPNRYINFEPESAHDDTIPHMIVDFSISSPLFTRRHNPSIYRRQIWPA